MIPFISLFLLRHQNVNLLLFPCRIKKFFQEVEEKFFGTDKKNTSRELIENVLYKKGSTFAIKKPKERKEKDQK